jgi:SpoVK/Ycf46/Vps4 family AAA+-type ATPase
MDGAAADADLLFLLTTNRADLLEPALAARPGRVDVAVEIALPDAEGRRRLFELYTRGVPLALGDADVDDVVARTDGMTASFIKELVRRAVLEALTAGIPAGEPLSGEHVSRALDDLLGSAQAVTRALLGVAAAGTDTDRAAAGHRGAGWMAHPGVAPSGSYASRLQIRYDD